MPVPGHKRRDGGASVSSIEYHLYAGATGGHLRCIQRDKRQLLRRDGGNTYRSVRYRHQRLDRDIATPSALSRSTSDVGVVSGKFLVPNSKNQGAVRHCLPKTVA